MQQIDQSNLEKEKEKDGMLEIHPAVRIGYVSLNVSDIQRSLEFYQSILGFRKVRKSSTDRVFLSSNGTESSRHLLELVQANQPRSNSIAAKSAGLYHFAILLPQRKNLADVLRYLSAKHDQVHFDGL